jgi:hypothetical protein
VCSQVYQKAVPTVFANRSFNPTSNRRNEAMFKEVTEAAQSIRVIDKDMKTLLKGIDGAVHLREQGSCSCSCFSLVKHCAARI